MSVLDQVRALEQQVRQRLRELRPLVDEYRDLEQVAERLGLKRDDSEATDPATPETATPSPQRKPAAKRAAGAPGSKRPATAKAKPAAAAPPTAAAKPKPLANAKPAAMAKPKAAAQAKPAAESKSKPPARRASNQRNATARKRSAAARGQREQDVLRLVEERPGVTVAELAAELQVDATGLYGVVRRLQGKGQITKDGTRLRLSDASDSTGDSAPEVASQPPAGSPDTPAATDEGSAPPPAQPAGASAIADESS